MSLYIATALIPEFKDVIIEQTGEVKRVPDNSKPLKEQRTFVKPELVYKTKKGEFILKLTTKTGADLPVPLKDKPEGLIAWNEGE